MSEGESLHRVDHTDCYFQVDWTEAWLLGLLGFHITTTVAIVLLRNHQLAQACILSVLGRFAPVYLTAGASLTHGGQHCNISIHQLYLHAHTINLMPPPSLSGGFD